MKKKQIILIILIISIILIDQISKVIITKNNGELFNNIKLEIVHNKGEVLGVGSNKTITFIINNIIVLGILIRFMIIQKEQIDKKTNFALSLVIAGGISNFLDRVCIGYIIGFIKISSIINFPKLNLADIFICIGWFLLAIFFASYTWKEIKSDNRKRSLN